MARTITMERETAQTNFGIARREDVNYDDVKKRWMESADKMDLPRDPRTQDEIQAAEDFNQSASFAEFFEVDDVEIAEGNANEAMILMAEAMETIAQEEIQLANEQRHLIIEEDSAEKIEQVEQFVTNEDDPLLMNEFKEKSEKIIQKWSVEDSKRDGTYDEVKEAAKSKYHATDDPWNSMNSNSNSGSRTATATSSKTSTTTVFADDENRKQEVYQMYANGRDNMLAFVHNGKVKDKPKKQAQVHRFGGKKKFSLKNMWGGVKRWFNGQDAKMLCKVGVALCFELGLGLITKKLSFDGPGQMLGYLGMMLGIFYIGSELRAEGFDMRRLAMV